METIGRVHNMETIVRVHNMKLNSYYCIVRISTNNRLARNAMHDAHTMSLLLYIMTYAKHTYTVNILI